MNRTLATTRPVARDARTGAMALGLALTLLLGGNALSWAAPGPGAAPLSVPTLSIGDRSVGEGDVGATTFTFTVTLSAGSASPVTVQYQTQNGTATLADQDYIAASGTLTIPAETLSGTLTVSAIGDSAHEAWETFQVVLSSPTNATIADGLGIGTISNDDPLPSLYIDDMSALEGNFGSRIFPLRVRLSRLNKVQAVTVNYTTQDGTASSGDLDYQFKSGTVSIPPGAIDRFVDVTVYGDVLDESDETFSLRATQPQGCVIADNTGVATIVDDEPGTSLSVTVLQPNGGERLYVGDPAELRWNATGNGFPINWVDLEVSRDGGQTFDAVVTGIPNTGLYRWDPVTGPSGPTGTVAFTAFLKVTAHDDQAGVGEDTSDQPFAIVDDPTRVATTTSLAVPATSACGSTLTLTATVSPAGATGMVDFFDGTTPLGEAPLDGSGQATLMVADLALGAHSLVARFDGSAGHRASVSAAVSHTVELVPTQTQIVLDSGTAHCHDPILLTGVVAPAPSTGTVRFFEGAQPLTDPVPVGAGGFAYATAALHAPGTHSIHAVYSGGGCWEGSVSSNATVEIQGFASTPISLAVSQNPVTTGDSLSVGVTLPTGATGTVQFFDGATSIGTATAAGGGAAIGLAFAVGDHPLSAVYSGSPCHPAATSNTVTLTVTPRPEISIADATAPEDDSPNMVFTVSLSIPSTQTVSVSYLLQNGTATAPSDYFSQSGSLTFPPGTVTRTISVIVRFDWIVEPDETFQVVLHTPVFATLADAVGLGTIANDDTVPDRPIYINDAAGNEGFVTGARFQFTIQGTNASGVPVSVDYRTVDGTAIAGEDYVAANGTVTILPNENNPTIDVFIQVVPDTLVEPNETFFVELSNPVNSTIERAVGQATIWNDDPVARLFVDDAQPVTEGASGTRMMRFTIRFVPGPGYATMVIQTRDGSATVAGGDYNPVTIGAGFGGVYQDYVDVPIRGDALYETDETVFLDLLDVSNTVLIGRTSAQGVIVNDDAPLGVHDGEPLEFALQRVTPNPSPGAIQVEYMLPAQAPVRLSVHDVQGREVAELVSDIRGPGRHAATWDGTVRGAPVPAGIYFVRCRSDERTAIARFVIAR